MTDVLGADQKESRLWVRDYPQPSVPIYCWRKSFEKDHLFNAIVLSKILYGFSVYAPSVSDLTIVQSLFLKKQNDDLRGATHQLLLIFSAFRKKRPPSFSPNLNIETTHDIAYFQGLKKHLRVLETNLA